MDAKLRLEFDDWLKRRSRDESWITVAQHDVTERDGWKEDHFMTSVLAPLDSDEVMLTNSQWLASNDFGEVEVGADGDWIEVQTEKCVGKNRDVRIESFTFLRSWRDTWPSRFEVIQNFILFYNLYLEGSTYMAVDGAGETTDVIRIRNERMHQKIEIRARFLRNYLACRNRVLVRQHDHRIHSDKMVAELGIEPFEGRKLVDSDYVFDLAVGNGGLTGKGPAVGLLNGKDLVRPFDKCQDILGWPQGNSEFIIGVDDHGDNVMASHSDDDGPSHFLIPVYFKREVLKKYYDSAKYKVNQDYISCGAHWGIPIDTNDADLVQVYLGDLAHLPANEQQHWQSYNVFPEGGITERRQARDFNASFVDSDDVVYLFRESLRNFQKRFEKRFGFLLFLPLGEGDAYKEDSIRVPLNDDSGEFEGQIQNLAILLPDSINRKHLERKMVLLLSEPTRLPGSIDKKQLEDLNVKYGVKNKGKPKSISIFEDFLMCESLPNTIISNLRQIQNLRSSGVDHRKGSEYIKNTSKYGLSEIGRKEFIRKLLADMTRAFDGLI